jgi:hypothetical protein
MRVIHLLSTIIAILSPEEGSAALACDGVWLHEMGLGRETKDFFDVISIVA